MFHFKLLSMYKINCSTRLDPEGKDYYRLTLVGIFFLLVNVFKDWPRSPLFTFKIQRFD